MRRFEIKKDGFVLLAFLKISADSEGNLSIRILFADGEATKEELLTISFPGKRKRNHAYIDTKRHGWEITKWLIDNALAEPAFSYLAGGDGIYPIYRFHASMLKKADPTGYEEYLSSLKKDG